MLTEVFDRMSAHLRADRTHRTNAVVHWRIGRPHTETDAYEWFRGDVRYAIRLAGQFEIPAV